MSQVPLIITYCSGVISEEAVAQVATLMPQPARSVVADAPPGPGPGTWAGAPSAARGDGEEIYLAYRLRRPGGQGRGYAAVGARSTDGVRFEALLTLAREELAAASLERAARARTPDGA